jgi:hypothetical protein
MCLTGRLNPICPYSLLASSPAFRLPLQARHRVPDIDCALLAPNDLSLNMGFPGQPDHPEVLAAIRE